MRVTWNCNLYSHRLWCVPKGKLNAKHVNQITVNSSCRSSKLEISLQENYMNKQRLENGMNENDRDKE
jgi:hypothetical protein